VRGDPEEPSLEALGEVLIARCALRVGAVVLTFDQHFYDIPGERAVSRLDA
jgi:hypothetical protein